MACLLEVSSEKPGSVTPTEQFDDLIYTDFLHSAVALGQVFRQNSHKSVGEIILASVKRCKSLSGSNVNLGIILLFAPLASAFYKRGKIGVEYVKPILTSLTVQDAKNAFKAIHLANPGGLGRVSAHDVRKTPAVTLLRAMKSAAGKDWIAHEYANNFDITFNVGTPELTQSVNTIGVFRDAVAQTYLKLLYLYPDSHISRRVSGEMALKVSEKAGKVLARGGMTSPTGRRAVCDFNNYLRSDSNNLNPGTTSDLITATLFVYFLRNGYSSLRQGIKGK